MNEKDERIFGMMPDEALAVADELCRQTDKNHPTKSGSSQDFISTIRAGRTLFINSRIHEWGCKYGNDR
jgi:hypothetical protein